ncbi:MAG TPA: hypothetical protein ENI80_08170 [Acidiferrobacteraceae bacterium]|nr:hypothetical protein [Acidiferrobacteraceae bacterium]
MIAGMHLTTIGDGNILLEPGDGLDPSQPGVYLEVLISHLQSNRTRRLIYDLSNVPIIDNIYYDWLVSVNSICRISGIEMVTANMAPTAAYNLATSIDHDPPFATALDVDSARQI